jgi:hypothetical protein
VPGTVELPVAVLLELPVPPVPVLLPVLLPALPPVPPPAPPPDCASAVAIANIALANKHNPYVTFFIFSSFGRPAG